ncbi:DUF6809 family protein [Paenibacillus donghaensis]|uniref:Uncharacterized protein n=1 Tax=Paenibacillus donghaensis TaxID=414771 RepID=A0A2Z2KCI7_9BACL|nr:DUF6809 family protein [Paenibacillus donghaensis]ASA23327.1 hypothetical protein B9T62_22480 [Paenibacillus donghaensis]
MGTLLEQLYHGNLCPDQNVTSGDPQYRLLSRKTSEAIEAWRKKHSEEEFDELEALLDLYGQTHGMELTSSFTNGFRLGAGILVEVLTGKDELANKISAFPDKTTL